MKRILFISMLGFLLLLNENVNASGKATVEFISNDSVNVGEIFTVKMNVKDVSDTTDGIVALGGRLSFDSEKIEYISAKEVNAPYKFEINDSYNSYKLAGLDYTMENGIFGETTIYEFTFKALTEGYTTITLDEPEITDSMDYMESIIISKNIKIESIKEEPVILMEDTSIKEEIEEDIEVVQVTNNIETTKEPVLLVNITKEEKINTPKLTSETLNVEITNQKSNKNIILNIKKIFNNIINSIKKTVES